MKKQKINEEIEKPISRRFNYHIFIDVSSEMAGYMIVESKKFEEILLLTAKLHPYSKIKRKEKYLESVSKNVRWRKVKTLIEDLVIEKREMQVGLFKDIATLLQENKDNLYFISVSDRIYFDVSKLLELVEKKNYLIVKSSDLKKDSEEFKVSLILETLLNLKRRKKK